MSEQGQWRYSNYQVCHPNGTGMHRSEKEVRRSTWGKEVKWERERERVGKRGGKERDMRGERDRVKMVDGRWNVVRRLRNDAVAAHYRKRQPPLEFMKLQFRPPRCTASEQFVSQRTEVKIIQSHLPFFPGLFPRVVMRNRSL